MVMSPLFVVGFPFFSFVVQHELNCYQIICKCRSNYHCKKPDPDSANQIFPQGAPWFLRGKLLDGD